MLRFASFFAVLAVVGLWCGDTEAHFRRGCGPCYPIPDVCLCPCAGPATIVVQAPEGAKIYFDDEPTSQTARTRVFSTPPLVVGKDYCYALKCEVTREGKMETKTRTITVRAFCTTEVDLGKPAGDGTTPKKPLRPPLDLPNLPPGLDLDDRP
jgi:uncharacterized protein (TIGR03000 family)